MARPRKFKVLFISRHGVGAHLLSRTLRERGHSVVIAAPEEVPALGRRGFDLVLATTNLYGVAINPLLSSVEAAKRANPKAKVVLGGPGFTSQPEAFLRHFGAHYGLSGEADNTIGELFGVFERHGLEPGWARIKGIDGAHYRAGNNRVYVNARRPVVTAGEVGKLPVIPFPVEQGMALFIQRGCPNKCVFCERPFGGKVRSSSVNALVDALKHVAEAHPEVRRVPLLGELFLPRRKAERLVGRIVEEGLHKRFNFSAEFTVDSLLDAEGNPDGAFLDRLASAGFTHINLGVESFSQRVLEGLGKVDSRGRQMYTALQAVKLVRALQARRFWGEFYLIGYSPNARPFDILEGSYRNVAMASAGSRPWFGSPLPLYALPNTRVFRDYEAMPRKLVDARTGRRLPGNANVRRLARRRPLELVALPMDEAAGGFSVPELLYMMEQRREFLDSALRKGGLGSPAEGAYRRELEALEKELPQARRMAAKLPGKLASRLSEYAEWMRLDLLAGAFDAPEVDVVALMRGEHPKLVSAAEATARKELAESGEDPAGPSFADRVREMLANAVFEHPHLMPRAAAEAALGEVYDNYLSPAGRMPYHKWPDPLHSPLSSHHRETGTAFAAIGRDKFIRTFSAARDPFTLLSARLMGHAGSFLPRHLSAIRPGKDSREILARGLHPKERRLLEKLAEQVPAERASGQSGRKP